MTIRTKSDTRCFLCEGDILKGEEYKTLECLKSYGGYNDKLCWLYFCLKCFGCGGKHLIEKISDKYQD
jgi:hypothetical protein